MMTAVMLAQTPMLAAVGMVLSTSLASVDAALPACRGGLFDRTARHGAVDPPSAPWVRRIRRVEVDCSRILSGAQAAEHLTLDLFPGVCLHFVRERATALPGGMVQWDGRVTGTNGGTITLIVNDSTVLVGTMRTDREVYEIRYLDDGAHAGLELDTSAFPPA